MVRRRGKEGETERLTNAKFCLSQNVDGLENISGYIPGLLFRGRGGGGWIGSGAVVCSNVPSELTESLNEFMID
jgi:hypothetical protein